MLPSVLRLYFYDFPEKEFYCALLVFPTSCAKLKKETERFEFCLTERKKKRKRGGD